MRIVKTLSVILAAIMLFSLVSFSVGADGDVPGEIRWELGEDGVLTVEADGAMPDYASEVDVPWHESATKIKKVCFADGVTSVGSYSFAACRNLETVEFPEGMEKIGDYAFARCYSLYRISVANSVTEIGREAFADCWQLGSVSISRWKSSLVKIGDGAFSGCTSLGVLTIPASLEEIGSAAFRSCIKLNGIILPDNLKTIGSFAFESCTSLTSIELPHMITVVPDFAFFDCKSLSEVTLGKYTVSVGREAFLRCDSLKRLFIPESVTEYGSHASGYYYTGGEYRRYEGFILGTASEDVRAAAEAEGVTVYFDDPEHVCSDICPFCRRCLDEECEYFACADKCAGHIFPITGEISDSITWSLSQAGELFIYGVGDMPDFTYDSAPWEISSDAVRLVYIGEGITSVGAYAFEGEKNIIGVDFPKSLKNIGVKAFYGCENLENVELPESLESISRMAFARCLSLGTVKFPTSLRSIGAYAFTDCARLASFELPDGLEAVGSCAFEGCTSARSITIPYSITSIGDYAFGFVYTTDRHYELADGVTILCGYGSEAMKYAKRFGVEFIRNDNHECTDSCPVCGKCLDSDCIYPECEKKCNGICTAVFDNPYIDVSENDWYYDGVRYSTLSGLFNGVTDNSFSPKGLVTRAQIVTVLWRLAGSPRASKLAPFTDLSADWYVLAISWAYENKIADGVGENSFAPDDCVTREQAALFIMRYADFIGDDVSDRASLDGYYDASEVSAYAKGAVSWAISKGIFTGIADGGRLCIEPRGSMTRAQAATVFTRMLRGV